MGLLYALESIRTPLLDKILGAVTYLGDELCFMVFAVGVFWCISKRMGYYLMTVGFFGTILNQFLKILCAVPRPWVKDPGFTIVESARAGASGYSFPSGHTQNAVTLYGGTARYTKTPWLRWVCIAVMVLICFSRMYLGVHTPLDVGVALAMGAVLVLALYPVMEEADRRPWVLTWVIGFMVVCSGAFVGYLYLRGDTGATAEDTANYLSALENGWKLLGATLGMRRSRTKRHLPPARMPTSRARPPTTLRSCTHHTARVSKWIYRRSSHQEMPKPTVAPSSFQPFSRPEVRLAGSTSAGKGYT